ncbi:LamG domain-containing protein [Leptospira kanakyensis]|uniref:LamG domain-containing protein n=1 Tax=Leptospira kanakyensis TaxID=2484968 RepID=A0A6N4QF01_9LEPT|nr:LamG domain-containing protein [Leptospira kanakyensis]TGK55435.1 LamG domain-containing protein [Leptospira kanakyensis]TGK60969.1 LamG domain-containing protein [Leptospira kanakyensis]TGK76557.1 LamG domain-containing protein [Leptospira kanakyensis]
MESSFRIIQQIRLFVFVFCLSSYCQPNAFNNTGDYESRSFTETEILKCFLEGRCGPKSTYGFQIPPALVSGLYAWYPLDGDINDKSGSAHHGYFPGGIWPVTTGPSYTLSRSNLPNGSASFNGTDQYFGSDFTPLCNEDFAIALWIFPNNATNNQIMSIQQYIGGDPGPRLLLDATGHFEFSAFFDFWANEDLTLGTSSTVLTANVWTHITYVHNGATQQGTIWVNGVGVGVTSDLTPNASQVTGCITGSSSRPWRTGKPLNIGFGFDNPRFYSGRMDDVWFFKGRQLSASDISTLMSLP